MGGCAMISSVWWLNGMLVGSATCYCRVPDLFLGTRSCFRWHFSVPYRGATVPFENRSRAQREGSCCSNARCRGFAVQMSWSEPVPVLPRPACGRLSSCASHLASLLRRERAHDRSCLSRGDRTAAWEAGYSALSTDTRPAFAADAGDTAVLCAAPACFLCSRTALAGLLSAAHANPAGRDMSSSS